MIVYRVSAFLGVLLLPFAAFGHHSFAATFASDVIVELEGEVTEVRWRNPHVGFTLKTVDSSGAETLWSMESHSLSIMRRMDLGTAFIHVGDRVKVAGNLPRRSDIKAMFVQNILLPSGEEWVFKFGASSADLLWSDRLLGSLDTWFATEGETSEADRGIFRAWSTSLADPDAVLFPETSFDPASVNNYPLTEAAKEALAAFDPVTDTPTLNCAPKGMPIIMEQPYPMEIVDQGDSILLRLEEYDTLRTIDLGVAVAGVNQPPSRLGYSAGHWEGSTLVVRTTKVNWMHFDTVGIPLSDSVEIVERFTPSEDGSRLGYRMTVTDPATFTEPVVLDKHWLSLPGIQVHPYECTN